MNTLRRWYAVTHAQRFQVWCPSSLRGMSSKQPWLWESQPIIKGSDETTPYSGFNEFYTLRVLERLKVMPVATCRMSEEGRVLVVERFDVDEQSLPRCGLEDACGLLGLPPHETRRALPALAVIAP